MQGELLHVILLIINLGLSFVSPDEYRPEDKLALELVNWDAYQYVMSEEEYLALQDYLPVLTNESTFIWQEGSLPSSKIYGHEPQQTVTIEEFRCNMSSGWPDYSASHPLEVLEVAVCDLDDDGTDELILYFHYTDYYFLVLTQEDGMIYGNDKYIRTFYNLQKNGVNNGSGGAGTTYYYQYIFENHRFSERYLGTENWVSVGEYAVCHYDIDYKEVDQETFEAWAASVMVGDVEFYAPSR